MRVLLVGATGAVGRPLLPLLLADNHQVYGTSTRTGALSALAEAGAEPVRLDILDAAATAEAVARIRPDVIVHLATALSGLGNNPRKIGAYFAVTNRLRTEGTANLIAAGDAIGGVRLVAQSFAGWPHGTAYADMPKALRPVLEAILTLERLVTGAGGTVLRYGGLYGPGTSLAPGGAQWEAISKRRFPLIGDASGVFSLVHTADAASATARAVASGVPGIFDVVDDEPARFADLVPYLARLTGAKPPRRIPVWLARLAAGEAGVFLMTRTSGESNARTRRELDWEPAYPNWRDGLRSTLETAAHHG